MGKPVFKKYVIEAYQIQPDGTRRILDDAEVFEVECRESFLNGRVKELVALLNDAADQIDPRTCYMSNHQRKVFATKIRKVINK